MTLNHQRKKDKRGRGIEWTDATWNPIAGCPHGCRWEMPDSEIAICYAEDIAQGLAQRAYAEGFAHHYWKPQHLGSPRKVKEPLKIFVGSMADVFAARVPDWQIGQILQVAKDCPQHIFQMLTKNGPRTKQFDMPENVWLGVSMPPDFMWGKKLSQDQKERMLHQMLNSLESSNAAVKWMSFEPLSWDVYPIVLEHPRVLDWAVIGAASNGPKKYLPDPEHFGKLASLLNLYGIPMFFKGNLHGLQAADKDWRQAFPSSDKGNSDV